MPDRTLAALAAYANEIDAAPAVSVHSAAVTAELTQRLASRPDGDGVLGLDDGVVSDLRAYAETLPAAAQTVRLSAARAGDADDGVYADLRAFAQQIADRPQPIVDGLKLAEADNAFDALRDLFRQKDGAPPEKPIIPRGTRPVPAQPSPAPGATIVGSDVCLGCHGGLAANYGFTLMGRLQKQGKMQCETCHGPGSVHIRSVGCAACHGDGGLTRRAGIPNLAGQEPQYLIAAMKKYVTGERKSDAMRPPVARMSDAELTNIAFYYARRTPARAQTAQRGDATAGKAASAACAGCHGEQGVSPNPAWPSLAGQDAQYLASALRAYKDGSRSDAMMKGIMASLNGRTIENLAAYYASLNPVQSEAAKNAPARPVPAVVLEAAPPEGYSVGGIISFRSNDPARTTEQNNAICLNCHERGARAYWQGSVHEERGVACTNCHTIMVAVSAKNQLRTAFQPDTCFQCHKDRRAQMFMSSHMPMREGKIVCSDCHAPHGSVTESLLKKASVNDVCYICHAEKRGPFLFEHAPVRENCLNCHDPHGSINQYSLKMQRPRLCVECHSLMESTSGNHSAFSNGASCQNCHVQIHGSNSPQGALFFR